MPHAKQEQDQVRAEEKPPRNRKDRAAEAYPDDATSMSVGPPSREARRSAEAVGEPQANPRRQGPSPPNKKREGVSAPPIAPAAASEGRGSRPERRVPKRTRRLPERETSKALRAEPEEE